MALLSIEVVIVSNVVVGHTKLFASASVFGLSLLSAVVVFVSNVEVRGTKSIALKSVFG